MLVPRSVAETRSLVLHIRNNCANFAVSLRFRSSGGLSNSLLSCGSRVRTAPESPGSKRPLASAGGRFVLSRKRWPSSPPLIGTFLKCVYLRTVASCPVRLVSVWPSACLGGPPFTGDDRPGRGIRGFACPMCRLPFLRPNRSINPADYSRFKIKNATFVAIGK